MTKIVFSSDQLPAHLDNRARFSMWCDMWTAQTGAADMKHDEEKPFHTIAEMVPLDGASVVRFETTTEMWARKRHHLSSNEPDDVAVCFSRGDIRQSLEQNGRQVDLRAGSVLVTTSGLPAESRNEGTVSWVMALMPRARMRELVPDVDSRIATLRDPRNPVVRHLGRYLDFLLQAHEVTQTPLLRDRTQATLTDLVALALGAKNDPAETASMRGLRAARLQDVVTLIQTRFADPDFSTSEVAAGLSVSRRYVNDLLFETGETFAERVLELRLRKARAMLRDASCDRLRISDIAFACGFNEVSYFNRRFRARFGCSPTQCRGG